MNTRVTNTTKGPKYLISKLAEKLEHPSAAWIILATSLLLTLVAWLLSNQLLSKRMQDRFDFRVNRVKTEIEERMRHYEQVMRGAIGLHISSDDVSREEWKTYVDNCGLQRFFPGIQGMGFAVVVDPADKSDHEAELRAQGFDEYRIYPTYDRGFYTSIVYLEPFDWRNRRAFGYDMYSEPTRRAAMDRAIETGLPAMSGMVTLVQETDEDTQNGFLYYLPLFQDGSAEDSLKGRKNLLGFVYAAFRVNDLMEGILGHKSDDLKFEIYDSPRVDSGRLLFDMDESPHFSSQSDSAFSKQVPLVIRGREWTIYFESCPGLYDSSDSFQSTLVAFGGLTVDVLLFLVIMVIGRQKRRAIKIAKEMTIDVRAREELISKILANASEAIVSINEDGAVELANETAEAMLGLASESDVKPQFDQFLKEQSWETLVEKLAGNDDEQYTCTVKAVRKNGEEFVCRMTLGMFAVNDRGYHIVVAQDETDRLESEQKMEEINEELVNASRTAGKVEAANGVLHNVGNIVNSISVSTNVIRSQFEKSVVDNLDRVCGLISEHESNFVEFVSTDERGQKIPLYLLKVRDALLEERNRLDDELQDLIRNVSHVKGVIISQQSLAKSVGGPQALIPAELVDDAVVANKAALANHDVEVIREIEPQLPELISDKHRILQILVNLIKNSYDALVENQTSHPKIVVKVSLHEESILFEVVDNGIGIAPEKLKKIFTHGFTTKRTGHGFGLHSSFQYAEELGGELVVTSPGVGLGATFQLLLPLSLESEVVAST